MYKFVYLLIMLVDYIYPYMCRAPTTESQRCSLHLSKIIMLELWP